MGRAKRKRRKHSQKKIEKTISRRDARRRTIRKWLGPAITVAIIALAVGVVVESQRRETEGTVEAAGDVVYVNNKKCAMSGSTIVDEDLGRFQSYVKYDGPIERFKGKTLVFNQCCAKCIEDFPAKWAAERDEIMVAFGLAAVE